MFACSNDTKSKITNSDDYNKFLVNNPLNSDFIHVDFRNPTVSQNSLQGIGVGLGANEYDTNFQEVANIQYLKEEEQSLLNALDINKESMSVYLMALARNYTSQHRFKEALETAIEARGMGSELDKSYGLLFDIHMELGNYAISEKYLDSIQGTSDFGYLIRLAKWCDYKGDLTTGIHFMEKALKKAETSNTIKIKLWANISLGDYYGRYGRIKDSYTQYLKALEQDPQNAYAKKGIAWIVFSHEKNPKEALRILDSVTKHYRTPDFYLLKAQIAEYIKDDLLYVLNLDAYYKEIKNPDYGNIYNANNVLLYLEQIHEYDKAIELAKKEVNNRPTPQSYSLLAYSYLKKGDTEKALEIVKNHLEGKDLQPFVTYHMAEIYKAIGDFRQVKNLKSGLLQASFEMGPTFEVRIANL